MFEYCQLLYEQINEVIYRSKSLYLFAHISLVWNRVGSLDALQIDFANGSYVMKSFNNSCVHTTNRTATIETRYNCVLL